MQGPSDEHLCWRCAVLLSDSLDVLFVQNRLKVLVFHRSIVRSKRAVRSEMNFVGLAKFQQLRILVVRVSLHLVDGRRDPCCGHQFLQFLDRKVADANVLDKALVDAFFQFLPGFSNRNLFVRDELGSFTVNVHWPMDQIEIEVVQSQISQGPTKSTFHVLWTMLGVP